MGIYSTQIDRIPVYIMIGQSNIDGRLYYPENPNGQNGTVTAEFEIFGTNNNMITIYRTGWNTTKNGVWQNLNLFVNNANVVTLVGRSICGQEMAFMKRMSDYKGKKVSLIKAAEGGTSLHTSWQPAGSTYLNAVAQIQDGLEKIASLGVPEIKQVIFFQGFSDMDTEANSNAYETNLTNLITNINNVISAIVPTWNNKWLIQESPVWTALEGGTPTTGVRPSAYQDTVRAAQATVGAMPNHQFLPNTGYTIWTGDDTHLVGSQYETMGEVWYNTLKDL